MWCKIKNDQQMTIKCYNFSVSLPVYCVQGLLIHITEIAFLGGAYLQRSHVEAHLTFQLPPPNNTPGSIIRY